MTLDPSHVLPLLQGNELNYHEMIAATKAAFAAAALPLKRTGEEREEKGPEHIVN